MSSNYVGNPANYPPDIPIEDDGDSPAAARLFNRAALEGLGDRTAHSAARLAELETQNTAKTVILSAHDVQLADHEARLRWKTETIADLPNESTTITATDGSVYFWGRAIVPTANRVITFATDRPLGTRITVVAYNSAYQVHILPGVAPRSLGIFVRMATSGNYDWVDLVLLEVEGDRNWFAVRGDFNP